MSEVTYPDEIPLPIPPPLQTILENDCIEIVQRKKLIILPTGVSVETILRNYYSYVCSQNSSNVEDAVNYSLLIEVLDGIKIYFDFTLEDHLLYDEEKTQYRSITGHVTQDSCHVMSNGIDNIKDQSIKATPSSLYGPIHLLRLFAKLPFFLSRARLPVGHVNVLCRYFKDILGYLSSHLDIFTDKYN